MSDKLELKLEITFSLDCPDNKKEKLKEALDDFGWWILQEAKLDKVIKAFPGTIETGYDVKVTDLESSKNEDIKTKH
jgi:hypothetical protein